MRPVWSDADVKSIGKSPWALFFIAALALFMSGIFLMQGLCWENAVEREEAVPLELVLRDFEVKTVDRRSRQEVWLLFEEGEPLYIDRNCTDEDVMKRLEKLSPGDMLSILRHPNADIVLDMKANGRTMVEFEQTHRILQFESRGFIGLGLFVLSAALVFIAGGFRLILKKHAGQEAAGRK